MYLHIFLLLLSSRSASCFLPEKETSVLQNKTISAIIEEMLCLLEAENENLKVNSRVEFSHSWGIRKASLLIPQKSSPHDHQCSEEMKTNFQHFKSCLENFLKWINQSKECDNKVIPGMDLYEDGKCSCPDSRRLQKGSL
uniref:Interleukin-7 n=1 Tax=Nothoprocta perdicaria TaxID=30464 RepID=A0A8C6YNM4_NOTPE